MKIKLIAALVALMAGGAAEAKLFVAKWSGAIFENGGSATGVFDIDTSVYPNGPEDFFRPLPDPAFRVISLSVSGVSAGNGVFGESDFNGFVFQSFGGLDFTRDLVGQIMSNGCTFGALSLTFEEGRCSFENSGDFNLSSLGASSARGDVTTFEADGSAPNGTFYFQLTSDGGFGDSLALVSLTAAVPEPASWALMIGGFAMTGAAMRRRKAALAA